MNTNAILHLESERLKVEIKTLGGTLHKVFDKVSGKELFWQGEERSWKSQDVIIFPFVARMVDKWYTVNGVRYTCESHGLVRNVLLTVLESTKTRAKLEFRSNEETKKSYPFDFVFHLIYELEKNTLKTTFNVLNSGDNTMYFGLGAHPAYQLDYVERQNKTDTSGNYLEFDTEQDLSYYALNSKGTFLDCLKPLGKVKRIELNKELMEKYPTLIMTGLTDSIVTLIRKDIKIKFNLNKPPYFALWTHPQYGNYYCIEPWWGLPDFVDTKRELKDKEGINSLMSKKTFSYTYTTTIL